MGDLVWCTAWSQDWNCNVADGACDARYAGSLWHRRMRRSFGRRLERCGLGWIEFLFSIHILLGIQFLNLYFRGCPDSGPCRRSFAGPVLAMGSCSPTHDAMKLRQGWGTPANWPVGFSRDKNNRRSFDYTDRKSAACSTQDDNSICLFAAPCPHCTGQRF